MKKRTRRILSLFLGLVMLFAHIFPSPAVTVRAAEEPTYVYKLTDGLTDGGEYLIVSANSGTAYALRNPGGTSGGANMAATAVTLQTGDVDLDGTEDVFIADAQANEIWTATASGSGFHLTNGTDTLEGKGGSVKIYNSIQYADRYWTYQGEQLKHGGGSASNTYTLYYSNGFTSSYNSTTNTVYLYVKTQVAQGDASVTGVSVSPAQLTLKVGKSEKLTATVEPADAANKQVAWTSSNAAIASVSSDGTVTGVAAGSAVITATTADGGFTGTCAVTVEEAVLENYVLVDAFTSGKDYLIVSANEAGSAYALRNPGATSGGASMGAEAVTIVNGAIGGSGASVLHIAVEDSEALAWRATANSTGFDLTNGGGYLEGKSGNVAIYSTQQYPARYWIYSGQKLTHEGGQYPYTLYYSNGFTGSSTSSSTGNIYIYEKSDGSVQNVPVTGVTVTPAQITMKAGQARDLSAEVEPANATNKNVAWTSSNTAVATVSAAGKVTAVAAGSAVITATTADGGFTGTCAVTVEEAALENYVLVDALTSGKDYLIVSANEAGSAYALRNPGATSGGASMAAEAVTIVNGAIGDGAAVLHIAVEDSEALAWRATANSTGFDLTNGGGYLEGKSGNVAIYSTQQYPARFWTYSGQQLKHTGGQNTYTVYYSDGFKAETSSSSTRKVYIYEKSEGSVQNVPVTGVTVTPEQITLQAGQAQDLSAAVEPANATNKNVAWTSSNTAVATVSAAGTVTAVAEGSAVITATTEDGSFTDTCAVTVTAGQGPIEPQTRTLYLLVNALADGKDYLIVSKNEAGSANALRNPGGTSGGASLAQTGVEVLREDVDQDGTEDLYIESVSEDAVWTATANGSGFNLKNGSDYVEGKSGNVRIYNSQQYPARYWTYSGQQLQHKGGNSTYTLYYSNNAFAGSSSSSTQKIYIYEKTEVNEGTAPVSGVTLEPAQLTLVEGRSAQLTATVLPADAANKSVTWASSNTSVATVSSSGLVTAVAAGNALITVTTVDGGYEAVCSVEVTAKPGGVGVNIGITSDVHGNISGLRQWLTAVQADVEPDLDAMLYCGDYSYQMQNLDNFVAEFQQVVSATNELVGEGKGVYTSGNHEYYIGGREIPLDERFTNTPGFVRIGQALVKPNYIVYCLGASGWGSNAVGNYPDADVAALEAYLATAPTDIPIFIPAHFPLHYTSGRTITGAKNVIDVLNEHPNTIFLWGHNHSQNDPHYGQVITPGGSITYSSGNTADINFTYACAGGMYQESQTNYSGLVCHISDTGDEVTFQYYRTSTGAPIGDETVIEIDQGQTPAVNYTITASAGEHGAIQPSGAVTVREGRSQTFTFAPEAGYEVDTVTVDGTAVEVSGLTYEFTDVRANHTINVTFKQAAVTSYQLVESVQAGGSYLIVSNGYALYNNNGTIHAVPVTVSADGKTVYITDGYNNSSAFWMLHAVTGTETSGDYTVKNGSYMLSRVSGGESGGATMPLEITTEEKFSTYSGLPYFEWSYNAADTELINTGGQNGDSSFYAYYNTSESAFYTTTDSQKTGFYGVSIPDWTWDEPTYEWAEDYSSVTATRVGNPDTTQVETETVETTSQVAKAATCTEAGETTYTATFTNPAFATQTKTVENLPALGHDWGEWTVSKAATCTEKGEEKRVCARCGEEETRETEPIGHAYGEPTYSWAEDNASVTGTVVCAHDASHKIIETVQTTTAERAATCTETGATTYTATFTNPVFTTQVKSLDNLPALGHDWGEWTVSKAATCTEKGEEKRVCARCGEEETRETEPIGHAWGTATYAWAEDNSSATGTVVCTHDTSHKITETVETVPEVTKAATCTEAGETTYTATFTKPEFTAQTKTVEDVEPLGHDWGEWTVSKAATCTEKGEEKRVCARCGEEETREIEALGHDWTMTTFIFAGDYSSAVATFVCRHDHDHVLTMTDENPVVNVVAEETCETDRVVTYTASVTGPDGMTYSTRSGNVIIPDTRTGHKWGKPSYEWAEDLSEVTATAVCEHDEDHVRTETVETTCVETPATCEEDGSKVYTAVFEDDYFETQEQTVVLPAIGHVWRMESFVFAGDYSSATATFVCRHDQARDHVITVTDPNPAVNVIRAETCETDRVVTYTATVTGPDDETYSYTTGEVTLAGTRLGHDWAEPVWAWNEDCTEAEATFVCGNDPEHIVKVKDEAPVTQVVAEETCETDRVIVYVATVTGPDGEKYSDTTEEVTVEGTATGHAWGAPVWSWSEDYSEAEAAFTCGNDPEHVVKVKDANPKVTIVRAATCEENRLETYTAAVTGPDGVVYTVTTEAVEIVGTAIGHEWGEPTYEWAENNSSVTAKIVCAHDENHVVTETAQTVYAVTKAASCEEAGVGTYTAEFTDERFTTQTKDVEIPATGHLWSPPVWSWAEDYSEAEATFTCALDHEHTAKVKDSEPKMTVVRAATCEENQVVTYTAVVTGPDGVVYTSTTARVEIAGSATGHSWGAPEWSWAEDYSAAEAAFTCTNDPEHTVTLPAEVVQTEGTGEDEGFFIYTATVTGPDGNIYTDVKKAEKPVVEELIRVYGNTRYKTGVAAAEELRAELGIEKFDTVILATGENYADALAGSYLAAAKSAPILLTGAKGYKLVNGYIKEHVTEGGTIYILGGQKAVPDEQLAGLEGYDLKRIFGNTRYLTAIAILEEAGVASGEEVIICTGDNYADSLSAASTGKPLFLVKDTLNNRQKEVLAALLDKGCTFTILGGEKAVTPEMEALIRAQVGNALAEERIAGSTRYHTSRMIAERYFPDAKSVVLAVGDNYPDGLCGGLLAATRKAPILLTIAGRESIAKVYAESRGIHAGLILGGPKLISDEMARNILGLDENVEVTERFYQ